MTAGHAAGDGTEGRFGLSLNLGAGVRAHWGDKDKNGVPWVYWVDAQTCSVDAVAVELGRAWIGERSAIIAVSRCFMSIAVGIVRMMGFGRAWFLVFSLAGCTGEKGDADGIVVDTDETDADTDSDTDTTNPPSASETGAPLRVWTFSRPTLSDSSRSFSLG